MASAKNVKTDIYEDLHSDILNHVYDFGEKINIDEICRKYSVSNSPVREALNMLQKKNLVEIKPNQGAFVTKMDAQKYSELADAIRMLLLGSYELCYISNKSDLLATNMEKAYKDLADCVADKNATDDDKMKKLLLFDKSFSLSTENSVILSIFDEYSDLMLLAYLFNHRNRQINWDFNVSRSQDMINRVRSRDYEVVKGHIWSKYASHLG